MFDKNKILYQGETKTTFGDIDKNKPFSEHCPFQNAKCIFNGHGWIDRCWSCKNNNNLIRK